MEAVVYSTYNHLDMGRTNGHGVWVDIRSARQSQELNKLLLRQPATLCIRR
jgi:hypothetical protein